MPSSAASSNNDSRGAKHDDDDNAALKADIVAHLPYSTVSLFGKSGFAHYSRTACPPAYVVRPYDMPPGTSPRAEWMEVFEKRKEHGGSVPLLVYWYGEPEGGQYCYSLIPPKKFVRYSAATSKMKAYDRTALAKQAQGLRLTAFDKKRIQAMQHLKSDLAIAGEVEEPTEEEEEEEPTEEEVEEPPKTTKRITRSSSASAGEKRKRQKRPEETHINSSPERMATFDGGDDHDDGDDAQEEGEMHPLLPAPREAVSQPNPSQTQKQTTTTITKASPPLPQMKLPISHIDSRSSDAELELESLRQRLRETREELGNAINENLRLQEKNKDLTNQNLELFECNEQKDQHINSLLKSNESKKETIDELSKRVASLEHQNQNLQESCRNQSVAIKALCGGGGSSSSTTLGRSASPPLSRRQDSSKTASSRSASQLIDEPHVTDL